MSVLIKGMKMPPSCYFCGLADTAFIHCEAFNPQKLLEEDCEERRPDWCPLIEIPDKHGRLIDADDVKRRMIPLSFSVQNWISEVELSNCRTVIKAEKVDE